MNKERRKKIDQIKDKLSEVKDLIEEVLEAEQEAYENLPESIMDSERGECIYNGIDALESAYNSCEEIEEYLDEAQG